jgi:hypothetical protein
MTADPYPCGPDVEWAIRSASVKSRVARSGSVAARTSATSRVGHMWDMARLPIKCASVATGVRPGQRRRRGDRYHYGRRPNMKVVQLVVMSKLEALPWATNGRSGVAFRAEEIKAAGAASARSA